MSVIKKVLKPSGLMHLKTDSEFMHGYTLGLLHGLGHEVIYANHNIYRNEVPRRSNFHTNFLRKSVS